MSSTGRATALAAGSATVAAKIGSVLALGTLINVALNTGQPLFIEQSLTSGPCILLVKPQGQTTITQQK
jgi:hypothetical protein